MAKQFADFSQLKELKKSLAVQDPAPAPARPVQQKRVKVIEKRSIHEEHARNEGFRKGQKVRMMDSNDVAEIVGFRKDCFELSYPDGLVFTATRSEFIVVNPEEDRAMYRAVPSSVRKTKVQETPQSQANETEVFDLHLEKIPGADSVPAWAALDCQMDYFRRTLSRNLRHRGKKIVFIHGFGDGRLRDAVRRELDEAFAMTCSYEPGTLDNYGPGTVIVTIR